MVVENPKSAIRAPQSPIANPAVGVAALFLNWLIPGLGYWIAGRRTRGTMQFLMVMITFALGIHLRGGVDWPSWSMSKPDFNLINNFTFLVQLLAGLPALLSLAVNQGQSIEIWHTLVSQLHLNILGGIPSHPYYELGAFYMIVAGAINYFSTCNLYDRLIHTQPRFRVQEGLEEEEAAEPK